ncbi:DUF3540 domain-containing protein [Desulfatitalea alkaliphila]|uniref:DUF3540 domain-containing protein n=1 Tax=Desulfatitalea alkaliphila TaxID=2929485 RepID=A0AA41R5E8_9BACT|nr:DUF3540 domain-containing protein [Desulfatitalea alkaliphila]MCJ8501783.1 DUF3540 domain-containing protein [Desulfatitalea alkaliphila]
MNHSARQTFSPEMVQEEARVLLADGRQCRLRSASGVYDARRAVSCLLAPRAGDRVLAALDAQGNAWVLAILERETTDAQQIALEGDVQLKVDGGRLSILARDGLEVETARDIRTLSGTLDVRSIQAAVHLQEGELQAGRLSGRVGALHWIANTVNSLVERMTQRVKRLYRTVDEFEQAKIGRMDYRIDKLLSFRSRYTVMTAKEDVKVDGERIHIG